MNIVYDTYAWIEYFLGSKKGMVVRDYFDKGTVITPLIVLLELSYKADKENWDFKKYLNFIKAKSQIVGMNEDFVLSFGGLYNKIKKEVRGISIADVIVLNTAILNDAKILTGDKHFADISNAILL